MLPVAFETLSVKTPHSGKSANPKSEPGSSPQFANMVDLSDNTDTSAHPPKADGGNRNGGQIAPTSQPSVSTPSLSSRTVSDGKKTLSVVAQSTTDDQGSSDQNGQVPEAADKDGTDKPKIGSKVVSATLAKLSMVRDDTDTIDSPETITPLDIIGLADALANAPASKTTAPTAPPVHSAKTTETATDPAGAAEDKQADSGLRAATGSPEASQPVAAAVITILDPSASAGDMADHPAEANPVAPTFGATDTLALKVTATSVDMKSGPQAVDHPDSKNAGPSIVPAELAEIGPNPQLLTDTTTFTQLTQPHEKPAQNGSLKLDPASSAQPDMSAPPQNPAAQAQGQLGAAISGSPQASPTEADAQKSAPPQHDLLLQDTPAAKNSNTPFSSTLSLDGISINIAAPAAMPHDPATGAAVAASPQSSPAVFVPVSGIAVEIASKALAGKNRFEIRLDPPELGRIHVRLDVDSSGQVSSHVVADRSDTLDLLRRDAPSLERALQDAGLKTSNNGLQFSLRDHGGFTRQDQPLPIPTNARLIVSDETLPAETTPLTYRPLAGLRSGVDIRV